MEPIPISPSRIVLFVLLEPTHMLLMTVVQIAGQIKFRARDILDASVGVDTLLKLGRLAVLLVKLENMPIKLPIPANSALPILIPRQGRTYVTCATLGWPLPLMEMFA